MMNYGAQGTIEYLVIMGIVVVISLVVVGLMTGLFSSFGGVTTTSSNIKNKIGVGGISIVDYAASSDGNGLFVLKNMGSESLVIEKITVDGVDHNFDNGQLNTGGDVGFKLKDLISCDASKKSYSITVHYVSSSGLRKSADFETITIDCTQDLVPKGNSIEENVSTAHFCGEISSAGYTVLSACSINASGNYILDANLTCPVGLTIGTDDVNINGNYCSLFGDIDGSTSYDIYGQGLPGHSFNLTNITVEGDILSNGGPAYGSGDGGVGGSITISGNSKVGNVVSNGGDGIGYGSGWGGSITIIDSTAENITSNGGNRGASGGAGGTITIINSNTANLYSNGGNESSWCGNGGLINISGISIVGNTYSDGGSSTYFGEGGDGGSITVNSPCPDFDNIGAFSCRAGTGTWGNGVDGTCDRVCS